MADNQELLDDLIYFARAGELEDFKETKVEPKLYVTKDESGKTALHMASANNHLGKTNTHGHSICIFTTIE
jgi:ankyrin repeat protein